MITDILALLKFFGLDSPVIAGGWFVAALSTMYMVYRINLVDKKYEEFVTKIAAILEKQNDEWRALITRADDMTFDMLQSSTQTMTVLAEKINMLQVLLLQQQNRGRDKND
jgi:hypothetical protein